MAARSLQGQLVNYILLEKLKLIRHNGFQTSDQCFDFFYVNNVLRRNFLFNLHTSHTPICVDTKLGS